jgi:hypothetical protein
LPQKWDRHKKDFGPNDDWILWNIQALEKGHAVGSERADTDASAPAKSSKGCKRGT